MIVRQGWLVTSGDGVLFHRVAFTTSLGRAGQPEGIHPVLPSPSISYDNKTFDFGEVSHLPFRGLFSQFRG